MMQASRCACPFARQAFLGIAFHVGGALDIAVQIATLAIVLRRNEMICNAPVGWAACCTAVAA
jgi:hypothetical protein